MEAKKIVIPNIEELDKDQYQELISLLDSVPLDYEIWGLQEERP